jgi:hypothetical protein
VGWDSPLRTSASNWPTVPASDDRWWVWSSWWNENWQGKPKYSQKTCPSATLSTTNPTWLDVGSNPGRRDGKLELCQGHHHVQSALIKHWLLDLRLNVQVICSREEQYKRVKWNHQTLNKQRSLWIRKEDNYAYCNVFRWLGRRSGW